MNTGDSPKTVSVEAIQWMHFAAVRAGKSLDQLQQTIKDELGILGKRLPDALADLFMPEKRQEVLELELLAFDADNEYAWINPEHFYFVAAREITAEFRFPADAAWKALVGAVAMKSQEQAGSWFSLTPGKKNFLRIKNSQAYQADLSDTLFRVLALLVRGVPDPDAEETDPEKIKRLLQACKAADTEAARKLEAVAWQLGDVNLWRFAMAMADGKSYLARMFEERIRV